MKLNFNQIIKSTLKWVYWNLSNIIHFVSDRNAIFINQLIIEIKNKKLLKVKIGDYVDYSVIDQIFANHDYGFEKLASYKELLSFYQKIVASNKFPLIIDCGANTGMATRYFLETFYKSFVLAIEPVIENINLAQENNCNLNVIFKCAGVGSSDTRANILDENGGNWAYRVEENKSGKIQICSINAFKVNKFTPFIVKIDIEGFEANLFEKIQSGMFFFLSLLSSFMTGHFLIKETQATF